MRRSGGICKTPRYWSKRILRIRAKAFQCKMFRLFQGKKAARVDSLQTQFQRTISWWMPPSPRSKPMRVFSSERIKSLWVWLTWGATRTATLPRNESRLPRNSIKSLTSQLVSEQPRPCWWEKEPFKPPSLVKRILLWSQMKSCPAWSHLIWLATLKAQWTSSLRIACCV